jgi:hypothetical protein
LGTVPSGLALDQQFVTTWSRRYAVTPLEHRLLNEVGPAVAERGYFQRDELLCVGEWKAPRVRPRLAQNLENDVNDITRIALAAPERLQHRVLGLLQGVGDPMASALLTVCAPDHHTVLDFRATEALDELYRRGALPAVSPGHAKGYLPDYVSYLGFCRATAEHLGVSLRDLDRALWQWSKEGMLR